MWHWSIRGNTMCCCPSEYGNLSQRSFNSVLLYMALSSPASLRNSPKAVKIAGRLNCKLTGDPGPCRTKNCIPTWLQSYQSSGGSFPWVSFFNVPQVHNSLVSVQHCQVIPDNLTSYASLSTAITSLFSHCSTKTDVSPNLLIPPE